MSMDKLTAIAAVGRGGVIGANGDVPWRIPEDWRRFKAVTLGGALIMGRVTFESIGPPLPGRVSIVVSRSHRTDETDAASHGTTGEVETQVIRVASLAEALAAAEALGLPTWVAGGAQLYRLAWPHLTDLDITEVEQAPVGDTFFPPIDPGDWVEESRDQRDGFAFVHYVRRR